MSEHYLLHLPHSGVKIPDAYLGDYLLSNDELRKNVYEYCDLYTDELFDDMYRYFGGVKNPYSRLFFDPERFGNDDEEEMHKKFKLGWFYENSILSNKPLRKTANKHTIRSFFDKHHAELNKKAKEKLALYGKCTIIDCHSFSNERYWFHDKDIQLPDICIGFEALHVDEKLVEIIKNEFDGYKIGINTPYKGSLVPTDYWQRETRVKSVMIEINKKIYLKPDNITKNTDFTLLKQKLNNILSMIS